MSNTNSIAIIGGGLAGLTLAYSLQEKGLNYELFEKDSELGGRIKTIKQDGFTFDVGFHVLLPEGYQLAELISNIEINKFNNGAIIKKENKSHLLANPLKHPSAILPGLFSKICSPKDKFLTFRLFLSVKPHYKRENISTLSFLRIYGFSENYIDYFFKPFFGGVFLDRELGTDAGMFKYLFARFARKGAALLTGGISEIINQVATKLDSSRIHLNSNVEMIDKKLVKLPNCDAKVFDTVVDARSLIDNSNSNGTSCFYFRAPNVNSIGKYLVLNANNDAEVNHFCMLSNVCPSYAPEGETLLSVTSLNPDADEKTILSDLKKLLPGESSGLELLKIFRIPNALPREPFMPQPLQIGDVYNRASQTGAIASALKLVQDLEH